MNLEHVRTFLEIAATGNFNRAAEALNVTQSTVSARIKTLETTLGRTLFKRSHNGVELTGAGHRFRRYALGMHRLWQQSHQELVLPEGFDSSLALGAQTSLWERLVLRWIPRMRVLYPNVALRVEADHPTGLMRQLVDGLIHVGVMYEPRNHTGLVIDHLFEERLVMVSTQPRSVSMGWVEDYVFVDWGDAFRAQHAESFPGLETPAVSIGVGAVALQYVLASGGSGYFPLRMVEPLLEQGVLHRVANAPDTRRSAYVVFPVSGKDDALLESALDALRNIAGEA